MKITLTFHTPLCLYEIGRRETNEDSIYPPKGNSFEAGASQIYMVCDGVGGLNKGEVASEIVCNVVSQYLKEKTIVTETDINEAVLLAERQIDDYINQNIDAIGMATTFTLLASHENGITIAHIGDSRIYHFRKGKILHKTFDHSFVNELLAKNVISAQEAVNHPQRNVVTKAIAGGGEHQRPDITHLENVSKEDYFFLCSDGITESLSDENLSSILNISNLDNAQKIETIRKKCEGNSRDNHSAYLLQVKEVKTANQRIWQNQKTMVWGLLGLLALALGAIIINIGGGTDNKLQNDKIKNSLGILDSIDVDEMGDSDIVLNELEEQIDSGMMTVSTKIEPGEVETEAELKSTAILKKEKEATALPNKTNPPVTKDPPAIAPKTDTPTLKDTIVQTIDNDSINLMLKSTLNDSTLVDSIKNKQSGN